MRVKPAQLILKSGEIFDGEAFGYTKEKVGELVFNTSMTGYPSSPTCHIPTNSFALLIRILLVPISMIMNPSLAVRVAW